MSGHGHTAPGLARLARHKAAATDWRSPAKRGTRGFTLGELMAVIAVIAIMATIAFVAIDNIQKNAQQAELDGTAKELFIVAQNHLSAADAQGTLARKTNKGQPVDGEDDVYYVIANSATKAELSPSSNAHYTSVLYQMLPFGSIDETVRAEGTYIIKYNLETATVLGVFYARSNYSSLFAANTNGFEFQDGDYAALFPGYEGPDNKQARQSYPSVSGQAVMVGYYGGDDLDALKGDRLQRPKLKIENAERLTAVVTNPNYNVDTGKLEPDRLRPTLKLIVMGSTSKAAKQITLINNGVPDVSMPYVDSIDGGKTFYVFLDDITVPGGHFAEIFGDFIPGENIKVQAVMYSTTKLTNVAESAKAHTNSLFASLRGVLPPGGSTLTYTTARVSNIRHLENLSGNVSGYDPTSTPWGGKGTQNAEQTRDLSWPEFQNAIVEPAAGDASTPTSAVLAARAQAAAQVRIIELSSLGRTAREGSFMPVSPLYNMVYDGRSHRISDVFVDRASGSAGVFGDLSGAKIRNLEVVNPQVNSDAGDAGGLAGSATRNTTIENVLVHNEVSSGTDAAYEIRGGGSAGGLVGSMNGGSVQASAAAAYVRSLGGNAGGLIGSAEGSLSVSSSYAGGHTSQGGYSESTGAGVAGRVNVVAASNAGGLVGSAGTLALANCYATASAQGGNAGGLVGSMGGGQVSNSYATGKVAGTSGAQGALIGANAGALLTGCNYLEIVNEGVGAVGSGAGGAAAADDNVAAYAAFATANGQAYPYDATLMSQYQGSYPYPTAASLAGVAESGAAPAHVKAHYGDWPMIETLVVNN